MKPTTHSDADWQAEQDLRTLIDAAKIRADKTRFKAAMKKREEMVLALSNVSTQET
jgi:hypothetical protein